MYNITIHSSGGGQTSFCKVTTPERTVYLKDANFCTLEFYFDNNAYNPVKRVDIEVQFVTNNGTFSYRASNYNYRMTFNMNEIFEKSFAMTTGSNPNVENGTVYIGNIALIGTIYGYSGADSYYNVSTGASVSMNIYDGYSLPNRAHGTDTAAYVPPDQVYQGQVEGERAHINQIFDEDVIINGNNIPAGTPYSFYQPNDCYEQYDIQVKGQPKSWSDDGFDWTYGIRMVMIDRVNITNLDKEYILSDELVNAGFNTDPAAVYDPVSVVLIPVEYNRGLWRVERFYSNRINPDTGDREMVFFSDDLYVKETATSSLFSIDWNNYSLQGTVHLNLYRSPTFFLEDGHYIADIDYSTPVIAQMTPIVRYDEGATDYETFKTQYELGGGLPLCAIRFYSQTYPLFSYTSNGGYQYIWHAVSFQGTDFYAGYWMFGNHLAWSHDKSVECAWMRSFIEAAAEHYCTIDEVGIGICQLCNGDWSDDGGWYTAEVTNELGRRPLQYSTMWYNLWYFLNGALNNRQLRQYEWHEDNDNMQITYALTGSYTGNRTRQLEKDSGQRLPASTFGIPMVQMYRCTVNVTIGGVTFDTPRQTLTFFQSNNLAYQGACYSSSYFALFDGINYYDYDGNITTQDNVGYVNINYQMVAESIFAMWDYIQSGDLVLDTMGGTFEYVPEIPYLTINSVTIDGDTQGIGTYGKFLMMPFTCNTPYVRMGGGGIDGERCAMFSSVCMVSESVNPDYSPLQLPHQILQVEKYYSTYCNLGEYVVIDGQNYYESFDRFEHISHGYQGNDRNLTLNYEGSENSRFIYYYEMLNVMEWSPSLHIADFNEYNDHSFTLTDGCSAGGNGSGDLVSGDAYNFAAYSFSMCGTEKPIVWLRYKNMDGLWRYLPAEVVEQQYKNARQDLSFIKPEYSVINAYPLWRPYSLQEKITVYIQNVPADMHIEDILYSTPLEIISNDGTYRVYVALEEDTITRNMDGGEDFTLHFIKKQ